MIKAGQAMRRLQGDKEQVLVTSTDADYVYVLDRHGFEHAVKIEQVDKYFDVDVNILPHEYEARYNNNVDSPDRHNISPPNYPSRMQIYAHKKSMTNEKKV